jgi:hypothetical protein
LKAWVLIDEIGSLREFIWDRIHSADCFKL